MKRPDQPVGPPVEFLARMRDLLPQAEFDAFVATYDQPARVGLRVNTLKISVPDFIRIAPFSLAPAGDWEPAAFFITDASRPGRHPFHDAGLYYLQDPSAMVAAALLSPAPGDIVLDLAAAPGGKATHLASLMAGDAPSQPVSALRRALDSDGLLVANDVHSGRVRLLAANLARWGTLNALVVQDDPERVAAAFGPAFDSVLIDAPCSGEGMFRRQESIEWSEAIVAACARRQRGILSLAPELVKVRGRLLYSTCTFAPAENEQVIASFLTGGEFQMVEPPRHNGFGRGRADWSAAPLPIAAQLERAVRLWPHRFPGEGHFMALMRREDTRNKHAGGAGSFAIRPPSRDELRLWHQFATAALTIDLPEERFFTYNQRLYLRPKTTLPFGRVRIVRYGLTLGQFKPGRFKPAHDLALALTAADATAAIDYAADDPQLATYLAGLDAPIRVPEGWALIAVDGFGLGWGKIAGGRLKNHYPRHLRRPNN